MKYIRNNKKRINIEKIDIIIFIIIILIFGIALLSFFPGILTSDCVDQIKQAAANKYYAAHPIIHSFIIGNLTKIGGIWVPALFQIIIFAFIWTYICKKLREYNTSKINKIIQVVVTVIVCCIPLNFMYAITLWKDILYSYAILLLLLLLYIGIKEKYKYSTAQIILISLSSVCIMKFRKNGVPIGFIMFFILFLLNAFKIKSIKSSGKFIISFIIIFGIFTLPEMCVNKVKTTKGGSILNSTKIYCFGALLNQNIQLEDSESEFLNSILDLQEWKENYDAYNGSPILFSSNIDHTVLANEENEKKFNEIFIKYAKQNKVAVIEHFKSVNSIWWSVKELGGMHSVVLSNSWISEMSNGIYDNHPIFERGNEKLINYTNKTFSNKRLYEMMYRPAFALYVSIILLVCICIKMRKEGWIGYCLLLFPMLMNIGTYVILISSQDQRYFYPCFMTEYFMILVTATTFIKNKKAHSRKYNKIKNDNKVLVIVPAYNEEKSIKKVVNDIYEQNIENCDVIVINDGSRDNTYYEAKKTKAIVIDSPNNLGIGGAVQTGYIYAKLNDYDIAIQIDGDGQHNPKYIKDLIAQIESGYDIVIGSRFIKRTGYDQTFFRMLGINIISGIIKFMTNQKIYDTTSGFRAVNRNIIEEFSESYPYDYPEPCTNMSMIQKGYKVKEVPVKMNNRTTGISSISKIKSIGYMLKVTLFLIIKGIVD